MLKNAGFVPPEVTLRNEIFNLKSLIRTLDDDQERLKRINELNYKVLQLGTRLGRPAELESYEDRFIDKLIG